ncbi:hypothetical protein SDC9_180051 [bioreactor metagenome]|uniref:Uncharacterized protein n=1 Tax=bioreactor metagenome TaxID=1076179 RepID=A0A645H0I7_9ZZZZ
MICKEHHFNILSLFHKVCIVHHLGSKRDLLESLGMHEVEAHIIFIEELVRPSFNAYCLYFLTSSVCVLQYPAILEVSHFHLYKCATLTWFNMLEPYYTAWLSIEINT